jgi:hypothetical protein
LATVAFSWALLATTFDKFAIIGESVSRTRELTTSYVLIAVALAAAPWKHWPSSLRIIVGAFGMAIAMGFLTWQLQEGSAIASNYWSQWLTALAMLLIGLAYGHRVWWLWRRIIVVYATAIAGFQLLLLAADWRQSGPLGGPAAFYGSRPVSASLALIMVVAAVMALSETGLGVKARNALVTFLGVSAVVAQNRSAWAALIVALVLLVVRYARQRAPIRQWWGVPAVSGFFLFAAVSPFATRVTLLPGGSQQGSALPDSFESTGTMSWRLDMWESRLEQHRSVVEWLVGGVFGKTPVWGPGSTVMNASISGHSIYVDLLTMLGLLGLVAFVALVYLGVTGNGGSAAEMPIVILAGLTYGFFYAWPALIWSVLGVAVASRRAGGEPER